jgi:type VI protein secretion system component VasK
MPRTTRPRPPAPGRAGVLDEAVRAAGRAAGPSAEELERFRSAARIRDVFFPHGGTQPAFQLTFRPLAMDQDIGRFQLEVDGQIVRYAHGAALPTVVKWPGSRGSARIDVTPTTEGEPVEYSGPWSLFRLLDHAAGRRRGRWDAFAWCSTSVAGMQV